MTATQPSCGGPDLRVEHDRLPVADDAQDRPLAQVEDRDGRDLKHSGVSSTVIVTPDGLAQASSRPSGYRPGPGPAGFRSAGRRPGRRTRPCPRPASSSGRLGRVRAATGDPPLDPGLLSDADRLRRSRREPDRREDLPRVDDLADRRADRDRLAGMAGQAVEHAVDRRADGVVDRDGPCENATAPSAVLILASASATASGRGPIIMTSELRLGRLLLEPGRGHAPGRPRRPAARRPRAGRAAGRAGRRAAWPVRRPPWPARPPARSPAAPRAAGRDLSSASDALSPSRVAVFSARSARATDLSSSTIGWPFLTASPCLTRSSWTCPSTAGVSIASFAGIASLRPSPSTVSTTVPRRAGSTRTVTWASLLLGVLFLCLRRLALLVAAGKAQTEQAPENPRLGLS